MEQNEKAKGTGFSISSFSLHIMAMLFMLSDHAWATVVNNQEWMTCVGRIAFPIFAFMLVEGYFHTHNIKKYLLRMVIFAVVSEIPFNLMYGGEVIYPYHQNVMWTFLIALLGMLLMDKARNRFKGIVGYLICIVIALLGTILGFVGMVDYYGVGVLTVFAFYFFRGRKWWNYLGQFVFLFFINKSLAGQCYDFTLFGKEFYFHQQMFAMLAFIPIWLYKGKQGYHSRWFQYFCYGFYPIHILILDLIALFIL